MAKLLVLFFSLTLFTKAEASSFYVHHHSKEFYKKVLISVAKKNRNNPQKLFVRNMLDPLVNILVEKSKSRTEAEKLAMIEGTWRSLWSDQVFGQGVDNDQVYQVVSGDGYYYNISKIDSENGALTAFLRGQFDVKESYLAIEFTANSIQFGFPKQGADLLKLATDVESGEIPTTPIPGPIGVTGALMNIYVDEDLRIVMGNSSADSRPRLFILQRAQSRG